MTHLEYQHISQNIPTNPGIYKYFDEDEVLIYVGKAKNLRKRTASYFNKNNNSYKTHELVQRIRKIEFTIVDSEQDAFLLENALIKQYQPKYNINLKDDKTYPYIVIKKEPFPRVFLTRKKYNDGEYLGPFTSSGKVRDLINFIKLYIPLRTCKLPLTQNNIQRGKFKVCLEYHLGNCKGPCEALQTEEEYQTGLQQIRQLLKGNLSPIIQQYKNIMGNYVADLQFEKAEIIKKKLEHLENYQAKSIIVSSHLTNLDVFSIIKEFETAYVNYLMVQNGTIVHTHTVELVTNIEETEEDTLLFAIAQLRENFNSMATEIIVPYPIDFPLSNVTVTVPKSGDKKKLLDLSLKNVNYFQLELKQKKVLKLEGKSDMEKKKVIYQLQKELQLTEAPVHIECFDNSNFQGSYPVSAMVCFKDGIPSKQDYRHYNVKTVEGINDFATMSEVVYRRYKRLTDENQPLPQLVIIDGGKGQLGAAMESIKKLDLVGKLTVVGLAKNEEEIFFPGKSESLKLDWDSDTLKLIRFIRDEVHRFGITFHRNKRSKGTFKNELEDINGIGKNTATSLLKAFKSVKNIAEKDIEALSEIVGLSKATIVYNHFNSEKVQA